MGSSREESNTSSEAVITTQTVVDALPIGMDSDDLADSPSADVVRPFSGLPVEAVAHVPTYLAGRVGHRSPGLLLTGGWLGKAPSLRNDHHRHFILLVLGVNCGTRRIILCVALWRVWHSSAPSTIPGMDWHPGVGWSSIINERLYNFMITKNILHSSQIGFMKGKRTSENHIFVLKCILEEAKSKRKNIYACFTDLKKAFDTVWREVLYYKLLFDCRMSTKFVNIMRSLYNNVTGSAKLHTGCTSNQIDISIRLRQGCNLSPNHFNLYINGLCKVLDQANIDPCPFAR